MSGFEKMTVKSSIRDYHVQETASWMGTLGTSMGNRDALIIDHDLHEMHKMELAMLRDETGAILVPVATRALKTFAYATRVIEVLSEHGLTRDSIIFVVGGGTVMDVGGFIASIYMRGVDWVYFPTTLLAQADSCIGGKTSLNLRGYKNQIGTFWPPCSVAIDRKFLFTLPGLEILSGIGEMLHFFLLVDEPHIASMLEDMLDPCMASAFPEIVDGARKSLEIKKIFVELDERDHGQRRLLNFGHTFGHAIEAVSADTPHGLAVAAGMTMACNISRDLGFLEPEVCKEMIALTTAVYAPYWAMSKASLQVPAVDVPGMLRAMSHDKKQRRNSDDSIQLILTSGPGAMFEMSVKADTLETLLPLSLEGAHKENLFQRI